MIIFEINEGKWCLMRNFRFICNCNYINVTHMLIRFIVSNFLSFLKKRSLICWLLSR